MPKKGVRIMLFVVIFLLILYLLAICLPYVPYKAVSKKAQTAFDPADCYSETVGRERADLLFDNQEALEMHLRLIDRAEKKITVATYQISPDTAAGRAYLVALSEAAARGVQIDFLTDGRNEWLSLRKDPLMQAFSRQKNVTISIYNPVDFLHPTTLMAAQHAKFLIIDDQYYLLGGRNLNDLFLGTAGPRHNQDAEIFVVETADAKGSSLRELESFFEELKTDVRTRPFCQTKQTAAIRKEEKALHTEQDALRKKYPAAYEKQYDLLKQTVPTNKITLLKTAATPENKPPLLWEQLNTLAASGKQVKIITPYLMCGQPMYRDLEQLFSKTEKAAILTNAPESGANLIGCSDYLNQKERIWSLGAEVNEYSNQKSLHMKAYLVDDRLAIIGSSNMDMRSVYIDTELMAAVDSPALFQKLEKEYDRMYAASRTVQKDGTYKVHADFQEKELSTGRKLLYTFLRIISPLIRRFT